MFSRYILRQQPQKLMSIRLYSSGQGFMKSTEEYNKGRKQDLTDEKINDIIRQAEDQRENQVNKTSVLTESENPSHFNVTKANKKIKKMVPKDVEKFD